MALALYENRPLEPDPLLYREEEQVEEKIKRLEEKIEEVKAGTLRELESSLEAYNAALALYEARLGGLEQLHAAATLIGSWKASTCLYSDGGVCKLWRIRPEAAQKLGDAAAKSEDGTLRVNIAKAPWFCALCPLYRQSREAARA